MVIKEVATNLGSFRPPPAVREMINNYFKETFNKDPKCVISLVLNI